MYPWSAGGKEVDAQVSRHVQARPAPRAMREQQKAGKERAPECCGAASLCAGCDSCVCPNTLCTCGRSGREVSKGQSAGLQCVHWPQPHTGCLLSCGRPPHLRLRDGVNLLIIKAHPLAAGRADQGHVVACMCAREGSARDVEARARVGARPAVSVGGRGGMGGTRRAP